VNTAPDPRAAIVDWLSPLAQLISRIPAKRIISIFSAGRIMLIRVYVQMGHANRLALAQLSREFCRCDLIKLRK